MIVAIKTLDGKQFDVEIEPGMLVSQVKAIVEAASPGRSFAVNFYKTFQDQRLITTPCFRSIFLQQ
jgi:hypothetical protein